MWHRDLLVRKKIIICQAIRLFRNSFFISYFIYSSKASDLLQYTYYNGVRNAHLRQLALDTQKLAVKKPRAVGIAQRFVAQRKQDNLPRSKIIWERFFVSVSFISLRLVIATYMIMV